MHVNARVEDAARDPSNHGGCTDDYRDGRCNVLYCLSLDVFVIDDAWVNWKNRSARERCFHFARRRKTALGIRIERTLDDRHECRRQIGPPVAKPKALAALVRVD